MKRIEQLLVIDTEYFFDPLLKSAEPITIDWDYMQHSLAAAEKEIQNIKTRLNLLKIEELSKQLQTTKKKGLK